MLLNVKDRSNSHGQEWRTASSFSQNPVSCCCNFHYLKKNALFPIRSPCWISSWRHPQISPLRVPTPRRPILDHGRFRIKGFQKRFHWGPQNPAISTVKRQNLTSHGGLSRLSRLKKWNIDEYCLEISGNMWKWCNPAVAFFSAIEEGCIHLWRLGILARDVQPTLKRLTIPVRDESIVQNPIGHSMENPGWLMGIPCWIMVVMIPSQSWVNHQPGSALHHQPG